MNKADSAAIAELLTENNFIQVYDPLSSDIIIINTCSVRQSAENRIWGRIGNFKSLKEIKPIILMVVGCMAQRAGEELLSINDAVDIVVGTFLRDKIPFILSNHKKCNRSVFIEGNDLSFYRPVPDKDNPKKAYVTISFGCNNFCSYCIVPFLRGRERSRKSSEIIDDIKRIADLGVIQVTLLGQNVNSYGKDISDMPFSELLKKISRETDIQWIKYLSCHPKDFNDDLINVIAEEDKISKWLHLAVQSGSNKILERMNRHYTIENYIDKIHKLKERIKNLNLTTDIIVGFPGESEDDYLKTYNLVKEIEFDDAFMYKYNSRKSTFAYDNYKDEISAIEKRERLSGIIDLQRDISRKKRLLRIGTEFEAIAEKWSKKGRGKILALTKEDIMMVFNGEEKDFKGVFKLKVTALKGNTLFGEKI